MLMLIKGLFIGVLKTDKPGIIIGLNGLGNIFEFFLSVACNHTADGDEKQSGLPLELKGVATTY